MIFGELTLQKMREHGWTFVDIYFDFSTLPSRKSTKKPKKREEDTVIEVINQGQYAGHVHATKDWMKSMNENGFCPAYLDSVYDRKKIEGYFDLLGFFHEDASEINPSLFEFYKGEKKLQDVDPELFVGKQGDALEFFVSNLIAELAFELGALEGHKEISTNPELMDLLADTDVEMGKIFIEKECQLKNSGASR